MTETVTRQVIQAVPADWRPYTANLSVAPYEVQAGETVEIGGDGFLPGADVDLVWHSVRGWYEATETGEFIGQTYDPVESVVASCRAGPDGAIRASFVVPLDFGGSHDVRARVAGEEVAQVGVMLRAAWSIEPAEGPVGTPIELKCVGVDSNPRVNTWHLLWDNHYLGMLTGVTTQGVGVARFRAAGPVGTHYVAAWRNSHNTSPYLAGDYSPLKAAGQTGLDFMFTVTADGGPIPAEVDNFADEATPGAGEPDLVRITPDRGTVGSAAELRGSGLPADADLDVVWCSMVGASVMNIAPTERRESLGRVRTAADGTLAMPLAIPDDLGGRHRIEICAGAGVVASAGFTILPSIVSYTKKARAGGRVEVHLKGVGWTEYDKNYAVDYDNSFIGYVCALSTNGDARFRFTATGAPGTHLLDLYPMIYKARDPLPVVAGVPQLSYADDHPGRKTPAIRLSIEVE
ncbi:MAG: hypothetical protein IT304_06705 [Dehalococcoidia bacterium]|nr:hypothetical protein [Dehalococcoidia bacterium]